MSEFTIIYRVLNMHHAIHSIRSNEYLLQDSETSQDLRWSVLDKEL